MRHESLIAMVAFGAVELAGCAGLANAGAPDSSDSPAEKRLEWLEQESTPQSPKSSDSSAPSTTADQGPSPAAQPPAPTPTPEQSWLASLEPLTNGGWQYFTSSGPGSGESVLYVSTHDITIQGKLVTAWFRWEFMTNQTYAIYQTYRSFVDRTEIDCATDATRELAATYYADSNLDGASNSQVADPKSAPWSPAVPGTIGELMVEWGCAQIRAHHR
jgi:hypothetical protein